MTTLTEAVSQWAFWSEGPGVKDPFVVTEWNPHLLEAHLNESPDASVLFTTHLHDLLPKLLARFPGKERDVFVPGLGAKEFVDVILGRQSSIQVVSLLDNFARKSPSGPVTSYLILNELHPFGGLVPSLTIIEELRKGGRRLPVYEHQIPLREMFVPDRAWSIHGFPPSAADITFSWRDRCGVESVPARLDLSRCLVFSCPLHVSPPASSALWRCFASGARIVTAATPFTRELAAEGVHLYSPQLFEDFDPFQAPPGSTVNRALAGALAREIRPWLC